MAFARRVFSRLKAHTDDSSVHGGGGGGGTASDSVVAETTWGAATASGASATYSRGDHTHGTQSNPTTHTNAEFIGETMLSAAAASIDFSGIAAGYKEFLLIGYMSGTTLAGANTITLRFNADAGANYGNEEFYAQGVAHGASTADNQVWISIGYVAQSSAGRTNAWVTNTATARKTTTIFCSDEKTYVVLKGAHWKNTTSEISQFTMYPASGGSFMAGTRITVWGYK